jgi:predicted amidohydrolase
MKLALYQGPSPAGDIDRAFDTVARVLASAAQAGAGMAIMPELFLPGYNKPDLHAALAQNRNGAWETRLAALCRAHRCGLTIGWAERDGDAIYNAASCFDATGTTLAHYRKIQLFGPMENAVFTPGDRYCSFDLDGRRAALLICYDVEFAHHVQALADSGATLLLVPTANPAGYDLVPRALVPARAAENRLTIAYANYCGTEGSLAYGGQSLVVGPDAEPLATAGRGPVLMIVDLDTIDGIDPAGLGTQARDRRLI